MGLLSHLWDAGCKAGKQFFFEKKNQKIFVYWARCRSVPRQHYKTTVPGNNPEVRRKKSNHEGIDLGF
jgi:hypothetical protein